MEGLDHQRVAIDPCSAEWKPGTERDRLAEILSWRAPLEPRSCQVEQPSRLCRQHLGDLGADSFADPIDGGERGSGPVTALTFMHRAQPGGWMLRFGCALTRIAT
ncbi:MAG: hypothetical protein WEC34_02955 [Acidimicrobiia bacterium]